MNNSEIITERAAVIAVMTDGRDENDLNASLDELERLLETAGGHACIRMVQRKEAPEAATYLGSGKLKELRELCENNEITLVVADTDLSPSQIYNMEEALGCSDPGVSLRVIDRSMLILDIFALHAQTAEGKLQVEIAQLKYVAPRMTGKGKDLSRQGGGIGSRGPGESKLESDRRILKKRIRSLENELENVEKRRAVQRKARDSSGICKAAIVGYTNAGKSTLLNRLTDAGILAEDKLFATLDPTTRRFTLPDGNEMLLVDTVGFIRNLPHHLIKSFRSTLDEAVYSDIIIIMADASDPECGAQLSVTRNLLSELGADGKPTLCVFNKCDRDGDALPPIPEGIPSENIFYVSAKTGEGIDGFVEGLSRLVGKRMSRQVFLIPFDRQDVVSALHRNANVESTDYTQDGIEITAICDAATKGKYRQWLKN